MSFTDGKPRIATEQECKAGWCGCKAGEHFRCYLCGYKFKIGDYWRCVFTNRPGVDPDASGNPLVCEKCDTSDVIERWAALARKFREMIDAPENWKLKYWYCSNDT